MLEVIGLRKSYGSWSLSMESRLRAGKGETIGLLGPNGAGKTTTVSMIAGLMRPDSGEVRIAGRTLRGDTDPAKRAIGLVPQDIGLYEELSAHENLHLFGALYDLTGAPLKRAMDEALALVGLSERAKDRVKDFSGGMKRRLNLAAALLHDPQLLLLDEPTVGVDPQSRNAIFDNLETLRKRGKTLLYTTHYMEEAERLCDRLVIIDHGKVIADDTLQGLHRMLPVANLLTVELADGESERPARATICNSCPGVESVELRGATLRIGVRDLRRFRRHPAVAGGARPSVPTRGERTREPGIGVSHTHRKEPARLMLTPFLALMRKDLRLFFSDRRAVMMSVVAPIAIASFFGYIFGGGAGNGDASRIAVLVSDQDGSAFSRVIVSRLQADAALDVKAATAEAARDAVRQGKATAAIVIPKNFFVDAVTALLGGGRKPEIGMLTTLRTRSRCA